MVLGTTMLLATGARAEDRVFGTHECNRAAMPQAQRTTERGFASGDLATGEVGGAMAAADHSCIGWVLGRVPSNVTVSWEDRARGARYAITPTRTYETANGERCRDYVAARSTRGKERRQTAYSACRGSDGAWRLGSPYEHLGPFPDHPWEGWSDTPDKWPAPADAQPGM